MTKEQLDALPLEIMKVVKTALDRSNLDIEALGVLYNTSDFSPCIAIMVDTEEGPRKAFEINIK